MLVQCPNCRAALDISAVPIGSAAQCSVCGQGFLTAAPPPIQRPRRPAAKRRPVWRWVAAGLIAAALLAAIAVAVRPALAPTPGGSIARAAARSGAIGRDEVVVSVRYVGRTPIDYRLDHRRNDAHGAEIEEGARCDTYEITTRETAHLPARRRIYRAWLHPRTGAFYYCDFWQFER